MDWERLKGQLEKILNTPVQRLNLPIGEWDTLAYEQSVAPRTSKSIIYAEQTAHLLERHGLFYDVLVIDEAGLTSTEKQLVGLMLESFRTFEKASTRVPAAEDERKANLIKEWFFRQFEMNVSHVELPDSLSAQLSLYSTKIPFLLYGDYSDNKSVRYQDLKKLLESFFDAEIILIPLMEKEWLILGSESLLTASIGEDKDHLEEESLEEALSSICYGLYEMLANEWVGECHLAIHYPMTPSKSLLSTTLQMRETMMIGRTFHLGMNIHLPWLMHLEKLLNGIPETEKVRFVDQVLKHVDHVLDAETQSTLEQFFTLDCNVSETAKKLYIHRNTLLYRLDKFKQETGLDVRTFNHAVLVKVALLLYKVTKRK